MSVVLSIVVLEGHDGGTAWTDILSTALKEAQQMSLPPDIFKVCTRLIFTNILKYLLLSAKNNLVIYDHILG